MKVKYHSFNANGIVTVKVPKEFKDELKDRWHNHKDLLKKSGIKSFKDYVSVVFMFNSAY